MTKRCSINLFQVGDEILKVNGFVLHESIHDEVVNVLKNKKSLTFVTKSESFSCLDWFDLI